MPGNRLNRHHRFLPCEDIEPSQRWPTVFVLDPHPRKPHMGIWAQILPDDDIQIVEEMELDADPADLRDHIFAVERAYSMRIADRIMDPNMGLSPASSQRGVTWLDEFANVGLNFALADDSDVGRGRINEYLRPDKRTLRPRLLSPALPADDFPDEALCLGQLPARRRKRPEAGAEAEERRFSDDAKISSEHRSVVQPASPRGPCCEIQQRV
jgi:hypothetical protein